MKGNKKLTSKLVKEKAEDLLGLIFDIAPIEVLDKCMDDDSNFTKSGKKLLSEIKKWLKYHVSTVKNTEEEEYDRHLGCPSYPNCDIDPNGCVRAVGIDNVEWYGHKD
jgi:hypothetical protein